MSEQLMYITVRIECQYANGTNGTGTGFFFRFLENKETGEPVSYTHLDVYKRQASILVRICPRLCLV